MKKMVISVLVVLTILSATTAAAYAAPAGIRRAPMGPFEGTFEGVVYGDRGSMAPLSLELTHRGDLVEGVVSLGDGLYVKAGRCGAAYVPAAEAFASGETKRNDPYRLAAESTVKVGGFEVTVELETEISDDGEAIQAEAKLDLPWICGRDPVLAGSLFRVSEL